MNKTTLAAVGVLFLFSALGANQAKGVPVPVRRPQRIGNQITIGQINVTDNMGLAVQSGNVNCVVSNPDGTVIGSATGRIINGSAGSFIINLQPEALSGAILVVSADEDNSRFTGSLTFTLNGAGDLTIGSMTVIVTDRSDAGR